MNRSTFGVVVSLAFLLGSGATALLRPSAWATLFGLPTRDARALAFIRAAGAREVVLALVGIATFLSGAMGAAAAIVGLSSTIGLVDFAVTLRLRGRAAKLNLVIHSMGIVTLSTAWLSQRNSR